MKGLGEIMKQAQEMQENLQRAQEQLASMEITGEAGGGMVRIVMTGRHDVRRVHIDPALMGDAGSAHSDPDTDRGFKDKEMLEDLIAAAVNDAVRKVEAASQDKMQGLAAGLNLPGGLKLPL